MNRYKWIKMGPVIWLAMALPLAADTISGADLEQLSAVRCGNLIYAGKQTSVCFGERFLVEAGKKTTIRTQPKFSTVKLSSSELFCYPMVVFSGEGKFSLSETERTNLKRYMELGGLVLASPSCSNAEWDISFRRELGILFPDATLEPIQQEHPIFSLVYPVPSLKLAKSSGFGSIEGLHLDGRLAMVYSKDGLNDAAHAKGCCCCGGNEIKASMEINVNILAYALMF